MNKEQLIKLTKELIFIAATYDKKDKSELSNVSKKLEAYKQKINSNEKYFQVAISFIDDIVDDIKNNREISLDNTKSDDYLENYFITKNEVNIYNELIDINLYNKIIEEKDLETIKKLISEIEQNYYKNIIKLNTKNISKNLLIFTLFKRNIVTELIIRLYNKIEKNGQLYEEKNKLATISKNYKSFLKEIYNYSNIYLRNWKFNTHFLEYKFNNWALELKDSYTDASKVWIRNWNRFFEYAMILKNIK